ncbi:hypothetical protein [Micromonospora sp. NPDC006431]|uniref:hypothetical protein n=1 Tax=Micromonospora sp. NPDC006431 TaxID=3364235 RepID=UPI0036B64868
MVLVGTAATFFPFRHTWLFFGPCPEKAASPSSSITSDGVARMVNLMALGVNLRYVIFSQLAMINASHFDRKRERMHLPKKLRLTLTAIVGISLTGIWASPAQAHFAVAYHGSDVATVSSGHTFVDVYDKEADGNGVYGIFHLYDGTTHQVNDPNGSAAGGGSAGFSAGVSWFYVCERNVGCSKVVDA